VILIYLLALLALGVYSYSQIDLNLTLFSAPWFLNFQQAMINLGYFNRPGSTLAYLIIISLLFLVYFFLLKKNLSQRGLIWLVGGIVVISLLSYPAFSHDVFNYLFDARIITQYHANPYFYKALDFPGDSWLRFMHWTHRTYPYGPAWLIMTTPLSVLGLGKFVPTLFLFKLLFALAYLGNAWLIRKITGKTWPVIFYAANPLVISESLISPHLDSVMAFFMLLGFWFLQQKRGWLFLASMLVSGGVKFLTWALAPLAIFDFHKAVRFSIVVLSLVLVPVILQREFYPWYLLPVFALLAISGGSGTAITLTFGLMLRYTTFLYTGEYTSATGVIQNVLTIAPVAGYSLWRLIFRLPRWRHSSQS
jgi:hypothetical protein